MHRNHHLFGIARQALKYGFWGFVAFCAWQSVEAVAGKVTVFDTRVGANLAAVIKMGANRNFVAVVAILAVGAGAWREVIHRRNIKGMSDHVRTLEQKLDPKRSSSKLLSNGKPTQEDLDDA